jgi:type II secretory pathway predicted ATPase ExeA
MPLEVVPRLSSQQGWLTYERFYGLKEKTFSLSSDPSFFYPSASHGAAFNELLSGVRRRESLSVLTGDIGAGKTTLCRTVLKNLDRQTFSAFVSDPFATREDLLKVVLVDFGIVSSSDLATGRLRGASRTELSYLLYEFLDTLSPLQACAVVFIDEAQNLSLPLLEEIRILSDLDGRERQLQVVLVGQPELREKLQLPDMRQLSQRVAVRCTLLPLNRDGVEGYIAHRLHVAGGSPDRVRFSREAIDAIFAASGGLPRLVNRLCDRALHHGHLRHLAVIDGPIAVLACADLDATAPAPASEPSRPPLSDVTELWFAETDACVQRAADALPAVDPDLTPPGWLRSAGRPERSRTVVPLTRMESLQRKWFRRLKVALLLLVGLVGAQLGIAFAERMMTQPLISPTVRNPAPPPLPKAFVVPLAPEADAAVPSANDHIPSL